MRARSGWKSKRKRAHPTVYSCAWAAAGGHLALLRWARAQDPPCPWDKETCALAAGGGHLELLRWATASGCPHDVEGCKKSAREKSMASVEDWLSEWEGGLTDPKDPGME